MTRPPFTVWDRRRAVPSALDGAVLAIGNFDGVHRGHRAVIAAAQTVARREGRPCGVLTFEPHPRSFFKPEVPLFRLSPPDVKLGLFAALGIDGAVVLPFDAALAATSAEAFIDEILVRDLRVGGLAMGFDFHFGRGRGGSPELMTQRLHQHGRPTVVVPPLEQGDAPVSSSRIRAALARGDVEAAAGALGYRWLVRGPVIHGDKRGRLLGYPTANIRLPASCDLAYGIYAVRLAVEGRVHDAVASFGRRPTFDDGDPRLEVFVFDFSGDLYNKVVEVEFCAYLRGEAKFDGVDALIKQMDADSAAARAALGRAADIPAPSMLPLPRVTT